MCLPDTRLVQYLPCLNFMVKDEEMGSERLSNLPEVIKLMTEEYKVEPNPDELLCQCFFHYMSPP